MELNVQLILVAKVLIELKMVYYSKVTMLYYSGDKEKVIPYDLT